MGKNEAKAKVTKELSAYREATKKLAGSACYMKAPEIMFTEAAADRLQHLCNDDELAALVEGGGTLEGCVRSVVAYCRQDIGNSGEVSEDDFRAAIRDYYRMPEKATASVTGSGGRATSSKPALREDGHDSAVEKTDEGAAPKRALRVPRIKAAAVAAPEPPAESAPAPVVQVLTKAEEEVLARHRRWEEKQRRIRESGPTMLDTQVNLFDSLAAPMAETKEGTDE